VSLSHAFEEAASPGAIGKKPLLKLPSNPPAQPFVGSVRLVRSEGGAFHQGVAREAPRRDAERSAVPQQLPGPLLPGPPLIFDIHSKRTIYSPSSKELGTCADESNIKGGSGSQLDASYSAPPPPLPCSSTSASTSAGTGTPPPPLPPPSAPVVQSAINTETKAPASVFETNPEALKRKEANRKKRERAKAKKMAVAVEAMSAPDRPTQACTCCTASGSPCSSTLCLLRKSGVGYQGSTNEPSRSCRSGVEAAAV